MDHERTRTEEPESVRETEWDTLGEQVEFNEAASEQPERTKEEEGREYLGYVFDAVYSKGIDSIVRNACFEGTEDEKEDRSAYVTSNALVGIISDEEQQEMIEGYINGEPVSDEIREKIKNGIIDLAIKTDMTEEISKDINLRKKHADYLAGRYEGLNLYSQDAQRIQSIRNLQTIIWSTDDFFYESEEARALLSDEDFIKRKYNVDRIVEETKEYYPKTSDEELTSQYISGISNCISYMVDNDEASIEEIIKDPFFRRDHFDILYKMETEYIEVKTELAELWRIDVDFKNSIEYGSMLAKYIKNNPDIYKDVDDGEVELLVTNALEKISDKQIVDIIKTYEKNPRKGDELIAKFLIPILGLKENKPTLKYGPAKGKEGGFYKRNEHSVTICEENLETVKKKDDDRILEKTSSLFGFGRKRLKDKMFYRMGAVAHEYWHARQWGGAYIPEQKREKYRKNFVYYVEGKSDYNSYRQQLIEKEAWAFGEKMEKRCHSMYDKLRGEKK